MEKIILSSYDDITEFTDEEQVKVRIVNLELKQSCWFTGEQRMHMIFNGNQCYQKVQMSPSNKKKYRVNLGYLSDQPERHVQYSYGWFALSATLLLLSGVLMFGDMIAVKSYELIIESLAAFSLFMGGMAFITGWMQSTNRLIFYSQYGNVPLLELIYQSPNKKTFNQFVRTLKQKISTANNTNKNSLKEYLTKELSELRRLKSETVITSGDFNKALQRIVNHDAYKGK